MGHAIRPHPQAESHAQRATLLFSPPEYGWQGNNGVAFLFATMAGKRHNQKDQSIIDNWHKRADELKADMVELGAVLEDAQPESQKADTAPEIPAAIFGFVKAAGDWELDVLANPYGGPNDGRDVDGEYFSPRTKFHEDKIPLPPVVYYHGFGDDKKPMGQPEWIGQTTKRWVNEKGVWYRVVLDRANQYAKRVWEAAQKQAARASTGVVLASQRVNRVTGEITSWLNGELSLFEVDSGKKPANSYAVAVPALKALLESHGLKADFTLDDEAKPETDATGPQGAANVARSQSSQSHSAKSAEKPNGEIEMDENKVAEIVANAIKADREAQAAAANAAKAEQEKIDNAVKAALAARDEKDAAARRLPLGAPYQTKFGDVQKFDNLEAADVALSIDLLNAQKMQGKSSGPSDAAFKALGLRLESDEGKKDVYKVASSMFKATGLKANELNHTTQAGYGDEWIGVAYSTQIWEAIRQNTFVAARLMARAIEVPAGNESIYLPLEGADPVFYKVAEATDNNATTGTPNATVTASKVASDRKLLTLAKMGARTIWSGEMEEDSLIPFVAQLRQQLETAGGETLEHVLIDGDTATGATTNINHIGGTPGGTEAYLLLNGFRKSCLVTTTANSRSASGSFAASDFLETLKLMGLAGRNADKRFTEFILDKWTAWKALELPEVKTRDVFAAPTLENGELTGIYGYKVNTSAFMHWANQDATYGLKANTAGKVDLTTPSNNTRGAILAVRFDQWRIGFRRRMTIETQRTARSDSTEIVALMRFGMVQRDTEASAISYNVGV